MSEKHFNPHSHEKRSISEQLHENGHKKGFFNFLPRFHVYFHDPSCTHSQTHSFTDTVILTVYPPILANNKGLWVVKWVFIGLMITTVLQIVVVFMYGSIALLTDTIHNLGNASTALPLAIAFSLARKTK